MITNSIYGFNNVEFGKLKGNLETNSKGNVFSKVIEDSINKINDYQKVADESVVSFIKGNEQEIHNVMIAIEEAKLTMQTAIEIRNKLVEAYQEPSKTQI